jgi:hypothetical protein
MEFMGEALNPILNYVEFRTNHEPYMVHGVVQGDRYPLLVTRKPIASTFLPTGRQALPAIQKDALWTEQIF